MHLKYKKKYDLGRFRYESFDPLNIPEGFPIIHQNSCPDSLVKFFPLEEYHIEALEGAYLYAGHPFDMNDILDSNKELLFGTRPMDYIKYCEPFNGFFPKEKIREYYEEDLINFNYKNYKQVMWTYLSNYFGLISFSDVQESNSNLMWPHYTMEKGFQLMFNTEILKESIKQKNKGLYCGLHPINYQTELTCIDFTQYEYFGIPFAYITNVKDEKWVYENEWRIIYSQPEMGIPFSKIGFSPYDDFIDFKNRFIYYDNNCIEEIIFGYNFFNGKVFSTNRLLDDKWELSFKAKTKENEKHLRLAKQLLEYVESNLSQKTYLSTVLRKRVHKQVHHLDRSKQKFDLKIEGDLILLEGDFSQQEIINLDSK